DQELELDRRQVDDFAVDGDFVPRLVDADRTGGQEVGRRGAARRSATLIRAINSPTPNGLVRELSAPRSSGVILSPSLSRVRTVPRPRSCSAPNLKIPMWP